MNETGKERHDSSLKSCHDHFEDKVFRAVCKKNKVRLQNFPKNKWIYGEKNQNEKKGRENDFLGWNSSIKLPHTGS